MQDWLHFTLNLSLQDQLLSKEDQNAGNIKKNMACRFVGSPF